MAWLLDTNVLSELRRPKADPKVVAFVSGAGARELHVSSVTLAEVGFGRRGSGFNFSASMECYKGRHHSRTMEQRNVWGHEGTSQVSPHARGMPGESEPSMPCSRSAKRAPSGQARGQAVSSPILKTAATAFGLDAVGAGFMAVFLPQKAPAAQVVITATGTVNAGSYDISVVDPSGATTTLTYGPRRASLLS